MPELDARLDEQEAEKRQPTQASRQHDPSAWDQGLRHLQSVAGNAAVARLVTGSQTNTRASVARKAGPEDLEGWGTPLLGRDDSKVTFHPVAAFTPSKESSPSDSDTPWYKKFVSSVTQLPDDGGYRGSLDIKAGTKGVVVLHVRAHFFLDQKWNEEFDHDISCRWDVEADPSGKLKFGMARTKQDSSIPEPDVAMDKIDSKQNEDSGELMCTPVWVGKQSSDSPISVGVKGSGDIGPVEAEGGVDIPIGEGVSYPRGSIPANFSLKINVTDIKPPEPEVIVGPMRIKHVHKVFFEDEKQASVSSDQEQKLGEWYYSTLSEETQQMLRDGDEKVKLDGHTSDTASVSFNRKLASERVTAVEGILRAFGAKQFDVAAPGEHPDVEEDPKRETPDPKRRNVVIEVWSAPLTPEE